MGLSTSEWNSLLYLRPSDFKHPDGLQFSIVQALDRFVPLIGSKPVVLSDFRAGDPRQHGVGRAIDTTWPGIDAATVNQKAFESKLFSGIGVYVNELGAVSHHFDTRTDRDSTNPARWGGIITHPLDTSTGDHVERVEYVGMNVVLEILKKKGVGLIISLMLLISGVWILSKRSRGR